MRLIDADALKKEVDNFQNCYNGWSDTYDKAYIIEAIERAPTIEAVSINDYRSMENTCYKLQKALYEKADHKTENSSEKPNNSTISKMEQVDKDKPKISCDGCRNFTDGGELCDLCALGEIDNYEPQNGKE